MEGISSEFPVNTLGKRARSQNLHQFTLKIYDKQNDATVSYMCDSDKCNCYNLQEIIAFSNIKFVHLKIYLNEEDMDRLLEQSEKNIKNNSLPMEMRTLFEKCKDFKNRPVQEPAAIVARTMTVNLVFSSWDMSRQDNQVFNIDFQTSIVDWEAILSNICLEFERIRRMTDLDQEKQRFSSMIDAQIRDQHYIGVLLDDYKPLVIFNKLTHPSGSLLNNANRINILFITCPKMASIGFQNRLNQLPQPLSKDDAQEYQLLAEVALAISDLVINFAYNSEISTTPWKKFEMDLLYVKGNRKTLLGIIKYKQTMGEQKTLSSQSTISELDANEKEDQNIR
ncbi:hypothetical protein FGO68_gene1149 [Halteria grandinella]|uniref:Uncharacterized protein n=1 Tax=Halteria grandinella TaxID=5974 RepID=A0A8J8P8M6_HALGN|nr:hypothetical protein FGO68_gene1149 [Halteria grandinella]